MSWVQRNLAHNDQGIVTWDSFAPTPGSYAGNIVWPGACNVINKAAFIALKAVFPGPTFIQKNASSSAAVPAGFSSTTIAFPAAVSAGNCVTVMMSYAALGINQIGITDDQGNVYKPVLEQHYPFEPNLAFAVFVAPGCIGGSSSPTTLTITQIGSNNFTSMSVAIQEYAGLSTLLPTGTPPANIGFYSDATGVCEAVAGNLGPDLNTIALSDTVANTAGDLLLLMAGTDTYCAGANASGGGAPLPSPPPTSPTTPPFSARGNIDYDQLRASVRSGPAAKFLMLSGVSGADGNVVVFDAVGDAMDSGQGLRGTISVSAATTAAADTSGLTYANGSGPFPGIAATLTGSVNTAITFDGQTLTAIGQLVLVKNDTQSPSGAFNGVYSLSQLQTASLPPILIRAATFNQPSNINNSGPIAIVAGTVNALSSWLLTSRVTTVGTSPLVFTEFTAGVGTVTHATGALTANQPVFGNATADIKVGTKRGSTTVMQCADATGATSGNLASYDANANVKDSGIAASAVFANPMTAKGDLIAGGTAGAATRLPVGSNGQILTADSTQTLGLKYQSFASGRQTYTATFAAATSVTVTHNLGTTGIVFNVWDSAGNQQIPQTATETSVNVLTLTFGAALPAGTWSITVVGDSAVTATTTPTLKTNGTTNGSQSLLNQVAGTGISITDDGAGNVTTAAPGLATQSAIQQESYTYAADTGATNAYAVALSPAPSLVAGSVVQFKAAHANTGASTLAVNGGSAIAIKKNGNSTPLQAGDIAAGQIAEAWYDGTLWQLLAPGGNTHSESLTDGNSNFIFAIGDIVTVVGIPN